MADITQGRQRTNILKHVEKKTIEYLCSVMPQWMTSDMLTLIGFLGSILISVGLYFAKFDKIYLAVIRLKMS